jgi:predicted NUDIX family NTP pyrophosphohydrolase
LVHRPRYDDSSLPKDKAKPKEHLLVTGLREMAKETGYRPRIGPYLVTVRYRVTSGGHPGSKLVTYWSTRCAGGSLRASSEVDDMEWLALEEARLRLACIRARPLREYTDLPRSRRLDQSFEDIPLRNFPG